MTNFDRSKVKYNLSQTIDNINLIDWQFEEYQKLDIHFDCKSDKYQVGTWDPIEIHRIGTSQMDSGIRKTKWSGFRDVQWVDTITKSWMNFYSQIPLATESAPNLHVFVWIRMKGESNSYYQLSCVWNISIKICRRQILGDFQSMPKELAAIILNELHWTEVWKS